MRISNVIDRRFCMINSADTIVLSFVRKVNINDFSDAFRVSRIYDQGDTIFSGWAKHQFWNET